MIKKVIAIVIGVVVLLLIALSITTVDVGERKLVTGFGKIKGTLSQGMHLVNPFYDVHTFTIRNNKFETTAAAASNDLQSASISVAVNYNIDESKIIDIYTTYGNDYTNKIFTQNVQEAVKSVSAKYSASDLITKREQVKSDMKSKLQQMTADVIIITDIAITNIDFSDSFDKAVEQKVVAEQNAQQAKANLEQKKLEAEAIRIQAEAIQHSGGVEYVQLEAIKKWDGRLPTTTGGAIPFINLTK